MTKKEIVAECELLIADTTRCIKTMNWQNPEVYKNWLSQAMAYVELSTRFLHLVAGTMPLERPELYKRFSKHAAEESGHDRLLVNDMKAMNCERLPAYTPTTEMTNFQREQILNKSPLFLFGYIIFLEGLAIQAGPFLFEAVTKAHGAKVGSFLKVHAFEDIEHVKEAYGALDNLSVYELEGVMVNLCKTADYYNQLLRLCNEVSVKKAG